MGAYSNGVYVPAIAEVGWGDELNDFLTRTGEQSIDITLAPYGATDGGNADTAIQAAFDDCPSGGKVIIPIGTFYVNPTTATQLKYYGNTTIEGMGPGSIIKVKTGTGDYPTIFRGKTTAEHNVTFRNFTIDMNSSGVTGDPTEGNDNTVQNAIRFEGGKGFTVEGMRFDPCSGINTITSGVSTGGANTVRNNYFRFEMVPTGPADYDNSVIYLECDGQVVEGNIFETSLSNKARACVETHGGHSTITGNQANNFQTFANVVTRIASFTDFDSNDIVVADNSITNTQFGIQLWSVTGKTLRNVSVTGNTIYCNNADRYAAGVTFSDQARGITLTLGVPTTGEYEGINISGNSIRMQQENRTLVNPELSAGILLVPQGSTSGILCHGNTIVNAPSIGIRLAQNDTGTATWHRRARITDNVIINAGCNNLVPNGYRCGILASGKLQDVDISQNTIVDTGSPQQTTLNGVAWYPDTSSTHLLSSQNRLNGSAGVITNIVGTPAVDEQSILEEIAAYVPTQIVMDNQEGGLGTAENLALYSEQFQQAATWVQSGSGAITANSVNGPSGALTADTWTKGLDTDYFTQTITGLGAAIGGKTYTAGIWVKGVGASIGRSVAYRLDDGVSENVGGTSLRFATLTSDWQQMSHTYTFAVGNIQTQVRIVFHSPDMLATEGVYVWGAQVQLASALGIYALTTAASVTSQVGLRLATGKMLAGGGFGVGNSAAATEALGITNQACIKKIQVFDAAGSSLGYIPVYAALA